MGDDIAIRVEHVSKDFSFSSSRANTLKSLFTGFLKEKQTDKNTQHALKDVSFEIKRGEFFGIVGRNGSGKSTLLKIIAGIYQPNRGRVSVTGKLVPFIELGVGFNPELTGRENVYMNGALLGFSIKEIDAFYDEVVEFAELNEFMDKKLKNYSSGMQVRLAFSMAIRARADILLIDEVLAVGDADFQRKCYEYFNELKNNKKTVVFVSHDMGAIQQYCDRVALIDESQLKSIGSPEVIASKYHRLFIAQQKVANEQRKGKSVSGEERWGDGKAEFTNVDIKNTEQGDKIVITVEAIAKQDIDNPILGFSIKNGVLAHLLGTNTARLKQKLGKMRTGDRIKLEWQVDNIFNEGIHYVDITFAHDNATIVSDRWPEAAMITIYRENSTPYLVHPPVSFAASITKNDVNHSKKKGSND